MFDGKKAQLREAMQRRRVGHFIGGKHEAAELGEEREGFEIGHAAVCQFQYFKAGKVFQGLQIVDGGVDGELQFA